MTVSSKCFYLDFHIILRIQETQVGRDQDQQYRDDIWIILCAWYYWLLS